MMFPILIILCFTCQTFCFLPENSPGILDTDFSIEDIVTLVVKNYLHVNISLANSDEESFLESFRNTETVGENLDSDDSSISLYRPLDHRVSKPRRRCCLFPNSERSLRIKEKIAEIIDYTTVSSVQYLDDPSWTFSNEKIKEGHRLLFNLRQQFVQTLQKEPVDNGQGRFLIGQIFHLIMSFYSNTNWVETHPGLLCDELGTQQEFPYRVAASTTPTCSSCGINVGGCEDNLITIHLTSGYWHRGLDRSNKSNDKIYTDSTSVGSGKCRHGGIIDSENGPNMVPGGINKMSGNPEISPHYFLHRKAVALAIAHCAKFLTHQAAGFVGYAGREGIDRLLGSLPDVTYVYIDAAGTPFELEKQLMQQFESNQDFYVLDIEMALTYACGYSEHSPLIIIRIENMLSQKTAPKECLDKNVHVFHLIPDTKREKRVKRRVITTTSSMNLYNVIAQVSGGSVYVTNKGDIGAVVDLIKETVSSKPPVSIMKFLLKKAKSNTFTIPVDDLIANLTIKIQSTINVKPLFNLFKPDGSQETFGDPKEATKQTLGSRLVVVKLTNPMNGLWKFTRTSSYEYEVEISAKTDLDFSYKFMQTGPGGFGEYPLVGRPIAGANTSVQVSVPLYDKVKSVDNMVVLDQSGTTKSTEILHNIGGRRGKSLFKTYINIPASEFKFAIEGRDKSGNLFRRLDPRLISTLAVKLEVLKVSGTLYVKGSVTLTYRVTNVGGGTTVVVVKISDDKGFAQSPTTRRHSLSSHQNVTGTFVIKAGTTKGETVTITVSANADGAPANKVQYSVQRLTVEENVTRAVDNDSPTCNVTKLIGKCDIGTDLCSCVNRTWSMEAEIGDVGFGLQSVFASGAGNQSVVHVDTFSSGHTLDKGVINATLKTDCCHQKATITAVDLSGNVGLCNVTISPNFVAPDPKLCVNPTNLNLNTKKGSKIECQTTKVSGVCDFQNSTCNTGSCPYDVLCKNMTWSMNAEISNHSYAISQVVPVNVGSSAMLIRVNDSIELSTDCCHSDVYINLIDIAGNIGQCYANTTVFYPTSTTVSVSQTPSNTSVLSSSSKDLPVPIIVGAVAGGGVVLIIGGVIIACLVKKHMANKVVALT